MLKFDIPVGQTVQFFKTGYKDGDPAAGIVTECNEEGIATLGVIPKFGGEILARASVRHVDDEWHKTHPEISKQCGAWDFLPVGSVVPVVEPEPTPEAETKKSLPEPKGRK